MRHIYEPRSHAENTYRIIREQDRFHRGVWNDGSAKKAHPSGLYYAVNAIPYSDRVEIRSGNRIWSTELPYLAQDIEIIGRINGAASGAINGGYQLTVADVGRFVRWSDGRHYRITEVHAWQYNTFRTDRDVPAGTIDNAKIRGMICALIWHRQLRWWVLHIDNRIFRARFDMADWEEIPMSGAWPNEARGEMKVFGKDVLLFNSAGIFRVSLGSHPVCYKTNESCPSAWLVNVSGTNIESYYARRYLMSYSRMPSAAYVFDRTSSGITVEHQSGTNVPKAEEGHYTDWFEKRQSHPVSDDHPSIIAVSDPINPFTHFTHYTLWGTRDAGARGTDPQNGVGNNPEQYWWVQDRPIMRTAIIESVQGNVITVNVPFFQSEDIAFGIPGSSPITITQVISSTKAEIPLGMPEFVGMVCYIGCNKITSGSQTGVWMTRNDGNTWDQNDKGKVLAFTTGEFDWIQEVSADGLSIRVSREREIVNCAVGWDPVNITLTDTVPDDDLSVRDGFLLSQRWLTAMPSCNGGAITPAFVFGIQCGGNTLFYCQRGDDTLIGYHHPGWQTQTCDEPLFVLSEFAHALVGYSRNGCSVWDLAAVQMMNKNDSEESRVVPLGLTPLAVLLTRKFTPGHGVLDRGAVQKLPDGSDIVVTYSREIRIHNGFEWSRNLIADRIMNRLRKLGAVSAVHYDTDNGFYIWGTERGAV